MIFDYFAKKQKPFRQTTPLGLFKNLLPPPQI